MGNKSYSKGISWINDCRIPFVDENIDFNQIQNQKYKENSFGGFQQKELIVIDTYKQQGRFPANILVSDDMLNDGSISSQGNLKLNKISGWGLGETKKNSIDFKGDKGTNSRYYDIDKWFDNLIDV